jgi:predicted RNA-binding protein with PUA-like domain
VPYLLKTEPSEYSFNDLIREKKSLWTGVTNPTARKHISEMKVGNEIVMYHTGNERSAVGLAVVSAGPSPDPENPKSLIVEITARARLKKPMTLEEIKALPEFSDSPLLRIGRLSVVPLTQAQFQLLCGSGQG